MIMLQTHTMKVTAQLWLFYFIEKRVEMMNATYCDKNKTKEKKKKSFPEEDV